MTDTRVKYIVTIARDGNMWEAMIGNNPMEGTVGWGKTWSEALHDLAEELEKELKGEGIVMDCIFMDKPKECQICLESRILQCLINKNHLLLTPRGKQRVIDYAILEVSHSRRYKTKSGEEQRPRNKEE